MTRFKKYIRTKGEWLECDFPFMPYNIGMPALESVLVDAENATISYVHVVGVLIKHYDRAGRCVVDFDEGGKR